MQGRPGAGGVTPVLARREGRPDHRAMADSRDHTADSIRDLLLRPLWTETEEHRTRRRCRLAFALPTAALAGIVWGVFSALEMGIDPAFGWTVLSAVAFTLFLWVEERIRPAAAELGRRVGLGPVGGPLWDVAVVGAGSFLVVDVLGAPVVPAVATALVLGGGYAWVMDGVLCGELGEGVARLLSPVHRPPVRPWTDHSLGEALAARGDLGAAMDYYRGCIRTDPGDPVPYLRLARHLATDAGRPRDAVGLLRRALDESRLDDRGVDVVEWMIRDLEGVTEDG